MTELRGVYLFDPEDPARRNEFDAVFTIPVTIDVAHHEIHEGAAFITQASDLTMADTETLILAFKTAPGTKRVHVIGAVSTLAGGIVELIEGPTWTNQSGSQNPIFNRKREDSMNSSTLLEDTGGVSFTATDNVILNPTGLAGGTAIHTVCAFGVKNRTPGGARGTQEWMLNPDTQYAMRFTATDNNNGAQLILDWYEHRDV